MEEKFIEVYDNILHPNLENAIETFCLNRLPFYYTSNVATAESKGFSPGLSHFFINTPPKKPHPNSEVFVPFFNNILYNFSSKFNIVVEKIIAGRLFMHLPSPNPGPDDVHTDSNLPHWVCLYYVTDSDGDTILFKDDRKTEITRVSPKKGRIVFFDGSIPHCSSRPTQNTRVIVNFDFNGDLIKEEN